MLRSSVRVQNTIFGTRIECGDLNFVATSITRAFAYDCESTTSPENSPMISRSSASLSPVLTVTSSNPPLGELRNTTL